jgi:NodT family efflux transporter outer membrane factor (OMF) lipoprotein
VSKTAGLGAAGAGLLLAATALAGCFASWPAPPQPSVQIPPAYGAAAGPPAAALPAPEWWRGFRSPELTRLIEAAQAVNLDIAIATAEIMQAEAQARIAGAPLFPAVGGDASATHAAPPGATGRTTYNVGLTASYILDFWGKNHATLQAAIENAVASRENREVVELSTIVAVATTYFQIAAARDELKIAHDNVASSLRILDVVKAQVAAGTASQLDLSQQESVVAMQRATVPPLEQTLRQDFATLAVLVARAPAGFKVDGGGIGSIAVPRVTPGLPSQLLARRPDIRQAEALLASAGYSVDAARAAFFPTIELTAAGGAQSAALKSLFAPGAWFYSLAAGLTQPILDGYLLKGQLQQAKGVQAQALQTYRKTVLSAFSDVEKALIAVEETSQQLRLQGDVVQSLRTAFDISETQLRAGTVNLTTVLQTEQSLFIAQDNLVQVQLARLDAILSLFQALGGGWPASGGARH